MLSFTNEKESNHDLKATTRSRILKPPIRAWL